ncbi:MAG: hypothetical protein A3F71_15845 [Burkholderiales bacterium RIFCSPLOWO2_12_FULL_64_33]|nr:MAG: hypothetical protein A3F71_15845 [Burkholderiales bacterium RIFCSPLOWO2_12_FULL_64_33]
MHKPRWASEHRGPRLALFIQRPQQQGGQLFKQLAVLIGHVIAQHHRTHGRHALAHAHARLQGLLTGVECLGRHRHRNRCSGHGGCHAATCSAVGSWSASTG